MKTRNQIAPPWRRAGFTFIEVLVAMLIFVLAVLAAVNITSGAVKATREAKEISRATWLLQKLMAELETKLETDGIDKACDKKKEGKFDAPDESFLWVTNCYEVDMRLSEAASQVAAMVEDDKDTNTTNAGVIQKMILDTASTYITKATREIHAEVTWKQGKTQRKITVTSHFVRYDLPSHPWVERERQPNDFPSCKSRIYVDRAPALPCDFFDNRNGDI